MSGETEIGTGRTRLISNAHPVENECVKTTLTCKTAKGTKKPSKDRTEIYQYL
jgi:hypothetical protein